MAEAKARKKQSVKSKKVVQPAPEPDVVVEEAVENAEIESSEVVEETAAEEVTPVVKTKAGKHGAKAVKEEEEKQAKEHRKTQKSDPAPVEEAKKIAKAPPRSRAERAGKKYRELAKLIEPGKSYSLSQALDLATKTSPTKFDASVEMHINLGVDPKQADQNIRGIVVLPAGTGKTVKVAVLCEPADEAKAKAAGADIVGADAIFATLDKEEINFDVLIASPSFMPKLGKYAKLLGPKGLMPNPKSGTVSADVAKATTDAKGGKIEYRVDSTGIVHLAVGKVSFGAAKLSENAEAVMGSLRAAKPASLKGVYIKSAFVTTTMGPSIKLTLE